MWLNLSSDRFVRVADPGDVGGDVERRGKRPEIKLQRVNLEGTIDLFNLLNANHVLLQTTTLGATFGRPTRILTPRIVRFGITARF